VGVAGEGDESIAGTKESDGMGVDADRQERRTEQVEAERRKS